MSDNIDNIRQKEQAESLVPFGIEKKEEIILDAQLSLPLEQTNTPIIPYEEKSIAPTINVDDLTPASLSASIGSIGGNSIYDGNKFFGGLNSPEFVWTDYWALRLQSAKLFQQNLYARGIIRRLITNEINTGLTLEADPNNEILTHLSDDDKNIWSENVESRFTIWGKNSQICDFKRKHTFGSLQRIARMEALVTGDVLVVIRQSQQTKIPSVQLISGNKVQTPFGHTVRKGNKIINGVELDNNGRQVAYWVMQDNNTSKRLAAFGERSGRRIAWLIYGTDKRLDDVRGEPILSLVMQSIKEIDRYRDSAQRKALINSILAMFIQKDDDKAGSKPFSAQATKRSDTTLSNPDGSTRNFEIQKQIPGLIMETLQTGEKPVGFDSAGTDVNFPIFEAAIINAIAWANEMPPEVLKLSFQNNYSASRAAVNEFKMYLNRSRSERAEEFGIPIYTEWLLSEVLLGKISAPGLLEAWRDPQKYEIFGAWIESDWAGAIKPSVDLNKEAKGYKEMIAAGLITRDRSSKELNGMKASRVAKQLVKENEALAKAYRPLLELEQEFGVEIINKKVTASDGIDIDAIVERTLELVNEGEG